MRFPHLLACRLLAATCLLLAATGPVTAQTIDAEPSRPQLVMVVAEGEYETKTSLVRFADDRLADQYETTFVYEDPADPNRLVGVGAVTNADVLLISVRRRTLPTEQLDLIRQYVAAGKPVIGIRTANHAFSVRNADVEQGRAVWPEWDQQVFGGNYTNHYGNNVDATITVDPNAAATSSLLVGLRELKPFVAGGSLYRVSPLQDRAVELLSGSVPDQPAEPVAWTFTRDDGGKSFYTSLGHVDDFAGQALPRLLENAIHWSLQ